MGCATSKLGDSPAVALCRDRRAFLDETVRRRFALAEAHADYLHSLKAVGLSLDRFFNLDSDPNPPVLNLPTRTKGGPNPTEPPGSPPVKIQHHHHLPSRSDSGSHLHLHSESEDDAVSSPVHQQHPYGGWESRNISYMKNQTPPYAAHTQRPMSPETMHMSEFSASSSSSYHPYPNYADNPNYNLHNDYQNYSNYPPRSSTWDFLNPFDTFENSNYPAYNNIPGKVREEEGIPDLEDEVVKKEVHGHKKKLINGEKSSKSKPLDHHDDGAPVQSDEDLGNTNKFMPGGEFEGDLEIVKEIRIQFELASDSGSDLAKFLEVGKLPYKSKLNSHHVSSKKLRLPAVFLQNSFSKSSKNYDPTLLDVDQDLELRSKNLSSTLHKLYLWETKLYEEVQVEEKMRVLHERKCRKTKRMGETGAEAHKVEAAKTFVRSLSTKIKIAIQVVDKISVKINTLRDEELWPQLNEFIQGLTKMWKSMLECHRNQCRAIRKAKRLDAIAYHKHFSDAHLEATRQLEYDLIHWTLGFSHWVTAQKGFIRSLNNWLMNCLLYDPEETFDGTVPFSPGRIGAPQVFVICHQWSQLLDKVSEKEVIDSMRDLASNVLKLWDRDKSEMQQRMWANKDERKIKRLKKEDHKIRKELQALYKRKVVVSVMDNNDMPLTGHVVYPSETKKDGSLKDSLQHVLEAMETFIANSLKVYEKILQRIEGDHIAGEHEKVS